MAGETVITIVEVKLRPAIGPVVVLVRGLVGLRHEEPLLCSAQAPDATRSFCTRSVGWAPFRNQRRALSLSILITEGSARGS